MDGQFDAKINENNISFPGAERQNGTTSVTVTSALYTWPGSALRSNIIRKVRSQTYDPSIPLKSAPYWNRLKLTCQDVIVNKKD